MKHNQGNVIETMWLPVNTEQKLLQCFQMPISHAILFSLLVYLHMFKVSKMAVISKFRFYKKNCQAITIHYQYSKMY